ncbi:MAG: hypothetical protein IJO81_05575 [Clostridia bacterium]|nr:hypothetical protein [Clostridia bacterium]
MKNYFKLLAVGIALVLCLFAVTSCGKGISVDDVTEDPLAAVETAFEKYADAIDGKYGKFFDAFDEVDTEASRQKLTFSMKDLGDAEIGMDVDAEENYAADIKISVSEIDANLKVWSDGEKLAISLPELLGNDKYGVNLSTFKDDVKESPMFNDEFTFEDFRDAIKDLVEDSFDMSVDELMGNLQNNIDGEKLDKYADDVKKTIEDITPVVSEESVGDVDCISVEYKLTKDEVKDIIDDFMDTLKAELEDIMPDVDFSDTTDYDDIDDISLKFYIAKKSGAIYKSVMTSGEDKITVDYSADLANPLNITLSGNADDEKVIATLKEEATTQSVDICFDVKATDENGERTSGASLNYDVKDKTLEIEVVSDGSAVFSTSGTLEVSDEKFAVSLDKIIVNNDDVDVKFSYSINTGAEVNVEDMPEYKDITDMDEDDFYALIEDFVNSEIGSQLYGIMQYGY